MRSIYTVFSIFTIHLVGIVVYTSLEIWKNQLYVLVRLVNPKGIVYPMTKSSANQSLWSALLRVYL